MNTTDIRNVAVFPQLGHSSGITSVAFSPDEKLIISSSEDNTLKLWDAATGREIRTFTGHDDWVNSVAFSPDGKQVLSGSNDDTIKLWDIETGQVIRTFTGHDDYVNSVAFSPNGKQVLSGSDDETIKLWDIETGRVIRTFKGHSDCVNSVVFSPDGKQVLSGSDDETFKLWDAATGRIIKTFKGHDNYVTSVAFSPNGKQVLSGSEDETLKLWDIKTGQLIRTFTGHGIVHSVTFSPNGKQVLSGSEDNTLELWDIETGQEVRIFRGHDNYITSVKFSHDGTHVLSGSDDETIMLWDTETGQEIKTFSTDIVFPTSSIAFNHDGSQFIRTFGPFINTWELSTGREINSFSGHTANVLSVAYSPDGKQVLSGSVDKTFKLWDAATGQEIRTFSGYNDEVRSVAFSPDGKHVLSSSNDGTIKLWDVATGQEIRTIITEHTTPWYWYVSVAFSPDGKLALSGSWDGIIKFWDITTGKEIRSFGHGNPVDSITFSPDGKRFIVCFLFDNVINIYDTVTGQEINALSGNCSGVHILEYSPDSKQILSCSLDGTTRIWDIETGREIASFVSFSRNDTLSDDSTRAVAKSVAKKVADTSGEWICITPDGYYAASPRADRYLNVRLGNKVTGIDSFREVFYNPDVVEARLAGRPDPESKRNLSIQDAAIFFPSTITLQAPSEAATNGTVNLAVSIVDDNQPIQSIKIFVNGNLIGGNDLAAVAGVQGLQADRASLTVTGNQKSVSFTIPLALDPGENLVEVVSFNGYAESRQNARITWQTGNDYRPVLPNLWIMAVGVNSYADNGIPSLNFCANDAQEIINSFKALEGKNYAKVNTLLIADGETLEPTSENIRDNLSFLERAGPRDVILLFLTGHGANGKGGMFEFLPSDAVKNQDGTLSNVITGDEINSVLETPGKRLIFIDACHSGGIDNNRIIRQLMNTNAYVFASSKGNELSLELPKLRHGAFTYSIIDTLKNPAARTAGKLSVIDLSGNVSMDVPRLTDNRQNPVGYSLGFSDFIIEQ